MKTVLWSLLAAGTFVLLTGCAAPRAAAEGAAAGDQLATLDTDRIAAICREACAEKYPDVNLDEYTLSFIYYRHGPAIVTAPLSVFYKKPLEGSTSMDDGWQSLKVIMYEDGSGVDVTRTVVERPSGAGRP